MAAAMKQKQDLAVALEVLDAELQSVSAGLIPPDRMLQALRDVLSSQSGVRLVSLRNFPVTNLVPVVQTANGTAPITNVANIAHAADSSPLPTASTTAHRYLTAGPAAATSKTTTSCSTRWLGGIAR